MNGISNTKWYNSGKVYERVFVGCTLVAFLLWVYGIFCNGELSNQFDLFFRRCADLFADTTNVVGYSAMRDVYNNQINGLAEKAYPPLTYMLMFFMSGFVDISTYYESGLLTSMIHDPEFMIIFFLVLGINMIAFYEMVRSCKEGNSCRKILFAIAIVLSAPMLFSIERGNTILITALLVIFYLFHYDSESKIKREVALIALALAVAFKLTPAVLGIFLLYNKQWKDAIKAVVYGVLVGILPFFFFEGGLNNFVLMIENIGIHFGAYNSSEGCTLLAAVLSYGITPSETLQTIMKLITYFICFVFVVSAPLLTRKWEKILAISMVLIILPAHSGYYCILYIIPTLIMFFNEKHHDLTDLIILIAFIMITIPLQTQITRVIFNYHLSILFIVLFLMVKCIKVIVINIKNRITQK